MEEIKTTISKARKLISKGKTKDALDLLTRSEDFINRENINAISSRFYIFEQKKHQGILDNEKANIELNKINIDFLAILKETKSYSVYPNKNILPSIIKKKKRIKNPTKIITFILFIVLFLSFATFYITSLPSVNKINSILYKLKDSNINREDKKRLINFIEDKYFSTKATVDIRINETPIEKGMSIRKYLNYLSLGYYNDCIVKKVNRTQLIINCPVK